MMKHLESNSDYELMRLIKGEKPLSDQAFKVLYDRYSSRLLSFCKFRTDDIRIAEEVFQDSWMKFYNALKNNYEVHTPIAFLYKNARNIIIDKFRSNSTYISVDSNFELDNLIEPFNLDVQIEKDDFIRIINLALLRLDESKKESFVLRWFGELSYFEIGEIIGENEATAKMRCRRAMDELVKILKPYFIAIPL